MASTVQIRSLSELTGARRAHRRLGFAMAGSAVLILILALTARPGALAA